MIRDFSAGLEPKGLLVCCSVAFYRRTFGTCFNQFSVSSLSNVEQTEVAQMGAGTKIKRTCKYLTTMKTSTWLYDGVFTSAGKIKTALLNEITVCSWSAG